MKWLKVVQQTFRKSYFWDFGNVSNDIASWQILDE